MIKTIFFDMSGVIYDDGLKEGAAQYEREYNMPRGKFYEIIHDFQGWKDFTLGRISERGYLDMCRERSGEYFFDEKKFIEYMDKSTAPNLEIINLAKELSRTYTIGIISNNPKEWFERFLQKTGLASIVKVRAVSAYLHIRKPAKEIFEQALKLAGVKGEEAIYIDDRSDRIDGAEQLKMNILIYNGNLENLKEKIKSCVSSH